MKHLKIPLVAILSLAITSWLSLAPLGATLALAQSQSTGQSTALERGYRTGYSDGYNAGYKDVGDQVPRDYQNKDEYQQANRSYNQVWGPLEDYRDGYQQGFEAGYAQGYDRQSFNSSIPTGLRRRDSADQTRDAQTADPQAADAPPTNNSDPGSTSNSVPTMSAPVLMPRDTTLMIELESNLSTDATQPNDRFQARVVEPAEYQGAMIDGRVTRVKRAGKVKGVAELQLTFDQITFPGNRTSGFSAEVVEVVDMGGMNGGEVDREGGVKGKDSTKDDISRVGAATGIGAIIGAIAGGGKGAAIGAAIGGGIGTGGVLSKRGKDIRLNRGQQLRIRTSTDTRIQ